LRVFSANQTPQGLDVIDDYTNFETNVISLLGLGLPGDVDEARVRDKAINKLLSNLRDSDINVAQAFAERRETARTIGDAAKSIAGVISGLRRGNYGAAAKALGINPPKRGQRRFNKQFVADAEGAIANGWLSLQYGWKPLLDDTYGAATRLAKVNLAGENPNTLFFVASGRSTQRFDVRQRTNVSLPSGYRGSDVQIKSAKGQISVLAKVRYSKSLPLVSDLRTLGITNPALLVWEVIPYSFVFDWFLPVGNYLAALDATYGLTFQSGFISVLTKLESKALWNTDISSGINYRSRAYSYEGTTVTMTRTLMGSFPQVPAPRFKNPVSTSHVASAFALLRQLSKR